MSETFESFGLSKWLLTQIEKIGLTTPTPIQKACIPEILAGKDVIGAAKTGSGKTFAFALPIIQKLSEEPAGFFALVLTPTHELAYQISEQFLVVGKSMGLRVAVISGGTDMLEESQNLMKRPHVVVAMPGRLADHLTGCDTFSFDALKFLVVDEADRVLCGSFDENLKIINAKLPEKRQNLFFSATLKDFLKESQVFPISKDVLEWSQESQVATVETLDQRYILCADYDRDMVLIETLRKFKEENERANVIIFTNTKKDCQLISMTLNAIGFENVCLHGFMRQKERVAALARFKSGHVKVLIATDVASRGLDIPSVQLVLNHRLPKFTKEYIHRVGRTARAGRDGLAISIFRFPRDLEYLAEVEEQIGTKLSEHKIDQRLVERIFMQVSVAKREAEMQLDTKDFDERIQNYRRKRWLEEGLDPDKMEEKYRREQKKKLKERRKAYQEEAIRRKKEQNPMMQDERFKSIDAQKFERPKKVKGEKFDKKSEKIQNPKITPLKDKKGQKMKKKS
ncbi:probable ATP-dependent RNA helicase Dbp45A [Culicoides brevitarsis]|uniref:probable ATP-dependent RNA helicase Dbp45A n=1 Tax=Culicoides brevitarsis TaxID=469753 RepID=UPI00307BDB3C